MVVETSPFAPGVRVIVVANEKGGSGKSTVAIHLAIALTRSGQNVATVDLDSSQRSFTHYIDNRLAWSRQRGLSLPTPAHVCFDEESEDTEAGTGPGGVVGGVGLQGGCPPSPVSPRRTTAS
jgi:hypothetical protein